MTENKTQEKLSFKDLETKKKQKEQMAQALNQKYSLQRRERFFEVDWSEEQEVLYVSFLLKDSSETFYYPVEGRMKWSSQDIPLSEGAWVLIEFIDSYFETYFDDDESIYLPIDWSDYSFEGISFQIKGQILNKRLEAMADEFLRNATQ